MTKPAPQFVPQHLTALRFRCNACGIEHQPDWIAARPFPTVPVPANNGAGHWVPIKLQSRCTCGASYDIELPIRKQIGRLFIYGDESVRDLERSLGKLYCFSTIGGSKKTIDALNERIAHLKASLLPESSPDSWRLHMKVLWSGNARKRDPKFASWNMDTADRLWLGIRAICNDLEGELWRHCVVIAGQAQPTVSPTEHEKNLRATAFRQILLLLIHESTAAGAQPCCHFDSQKEVVATEAIHGWAEQLFIQSTFTLLHAFVAHGIAVPRPIFVRPASTPALELADVLSFCAARHLWCEERGKKSDVDLTVFGTVRYLTVEASSGDLVFTGSKGWPWKMQW